MTGVTASTNGNRAGTRGLELLPAMDLLATGTLGERTLSMLRSL